MIEVGDLVRGKKTENGKEYYGITSSKSICEVGEIGIEDWITVTLVNSPDFVEYIGHEFDVRVAIWKKFIIKPSNCGQKHSEYGIIIVGR